MPGIEPRAFGTDRDHIQVRVTMSRSCMQLRVELLQQFTFEDAELRQLRADNVRRRELAVDRSPELPFKS